MEAIKIIENREELENEIANTIVYLERELEKIAFAFNSKINGVKIKLYKIEEEKQRPISCDEVAKNSGGEGFLSAFVILSSLLTYIRKDFKDIFTKYESGKVLIMDNPFVQTSSSYLLKPLMDIAKKVILS